MIAVYIILGIALLIALLLLLKVKLFVCYDESMRIYAQILFFKIYLVPSKYKPKKQKKKKRDEPSPPPPPRDDGDGDKGTGKSIVVKLWEMKEGLIQLLEKFFNKLHFKFITLKVIIGCENACKTALCYAGVNQGIAYIIEVLRNVSNVELAPFSDISVESDFISQKSFFEGKIELYIRVGSLVSVGLSALKQYFIFKAKTED
ncbi:MAG: hypothetical protein J6B29_02205 [Clostridia bacterium]|nr:hypothetical protein [Clostridia bacterium]